MIKIKNLSGNIKAFIKKENHIVKPNNVNIKNEILEFMQLTDKQLTNKAINKFIQKLYNFDNQNQYNIVSSIKVVNTEYNNIAGYIKSCSLLLNSYQQEVVLNAFKNIRDLNMRKSQILISYFHENQHIQQCKILKQGLQGKQLNCIDTRIACELLADKMYLNYNKKFIEIQANYFALKRFEELINTQLIASNKAIISQLLNLSSKLYKNINTENSILKQCVCKNTEKLVQEFSKNHLQILCNVLQNKNIKHQQRKMLSENLSVKCNEQVFYAELEKISDFCIEICKKYNSILYYKLIEELSLNEKGLETLTKNRYNKFKELEVKNALNPIQLTSELLSDSFNTDFKIQTKGDLEYEK